MKRQEVCATVTNMGADYILVEHADGRFTLDTVLEEE
jgi:hypothetical protein